MMKYCLRSFFVLTNNLIFNLTDYAFVVICTADDEEPTERRKRCEEDSAGPTSFCETVSLMDNKSAPSHYFRMGRAGDNYLATSSCYSSTICCFIR